MTIPSTLAVCRCRTSKRFRIGSRVAPVSSPSSALARGVSSTHQIVCVLGARSSWTPVTGMTTPAISFGKARTASGRATLAE
jgi:cell division protein FtsW (lipid II flippase)